MDTNQELKGLESIQILAFREGEEDRLETDVPGISLQTNFQFKQKTIHRITDFYAYFFLQI